jgi:hypothetical protein
MTHPGTFINTFDRQRLFSSSLYNPSMRLHSHDHFLLFYQSLRWLYRCGRPIGQNGLANLVRWPTQVYRSQPYLLFRNPRKGTCVLISSLSRKLLFYHIEYSVLYNLQLHDTYWTIYQKYVNLKYLFNSFAFVQSLPVLCEM